MEPTLKTEENNHFLPQKKATYVSPKIEILEIKVEKGFAASPVGSGGSSASDWGWGSW